MAALELVEGTARVALLHDVGGAIAAFTWRGRDVLRPMPAEAIAAGNVRLAACYPLVPYSNRIRDARLRFEGTAHELVRNFGDHPHAIHGVGWQRAWRIERASGASACLRYAHDPRGDDARAWPWPFTATQAFALDGDAAGARLDVTLTIVNTGATAFPFGLGWHPFFPRDAATTLRFDARDVALNDATQLPVRRVAATGMWSFAAARDLGRATIDNVFAGWRGRADLAAADGTTTTLAADSACDRLVVYAPEGCDFIAVEPVTHDTDAFNGAADGEPDTGMRTLRPGQAFSCTMRIAVAAPRHA
jgi:aldose 1-epimerase